MKNSTASKAKDYILVFRCILCDYKVAKSVAISATLSILGDAHQKTNCSRSLILSDVQLTPEQSGYALPAVNLTSKISAT